MSNPSVKTEKAASDGSFNRLFASILIPVALVIGYLVFKFILGNPGILWTIILKVIRYQVTISG